MQELNLIPEWNNNNNNQDMIEQELEMLFGRF